MWKKSLNVILEGFHRFSSSTQPLLNTASLLVLFVFQHYMAPPQDLKTALQQKGIHESNFITLKHGETKIVNTEDTVV